MCARIARAWFVGLTMLTGTCTGQSGAGAASCSLAGDPKPDGSCQCDRGFRGVDCSALDTTGRAKVTLPGLPAEVTHTKVGTVWGGHTARDPATREWHWFGSALRNGSGLGSWATDSAAGHGVGTPTRATLVDLPLVPDGGPGWYGGSIHGVYLVQNPAPWRNNSDGWLLFFTGFPTLNALAHRSIGVAYAGSLAGPWTVWPAPVLTANPNASAVDASSVSNAAPAFARDGSGRLLLAYKGLGKAAPSKPPCTDGSGKACISVAAAAHWTGPYDHLTADAGLILEGEDPTLWQSPCGTWYDHLSALSSHT